MWKKILMGCLSFIGMIALFYTMNPIIEAATIVSPTPSVSYEPATWVSNPTVMLKESNPTDAITLVSTFKPSLSQVEKGKILCNTESGGADIDAWLSGTSDMKYTFHLFLDGKLTQIDTTLPYVKDEPVTLVARYNNQYMQLFINGELQASGAYSGAISPPLNHTQWAVGTNPNGSELTSLSHFLGSVKNAYVFTTAVGEEINFINPESAAVINSYTTSYPQSVEDTLAIAKVSDDTNSAIKQDVTYCVLDANNECTGTSNDILSLNDNGDGTVNIKTKTKGSAKIRAQYHQIIDTADQAPFYTISDLTVTVNDVTTSFNETYTSGNIHEYSINTNPLDQIGILTVRGPVTPFRYEIIQAPAYKNDSVHNDDWTNFELSNDYAQEKAAIQIKSGATDLVNGSLKAGEYFFRIQAVDAKGNSQPLVYKDINIKVSKTSPLISFDTKNQGTVSIIGSITDTTKHIDHATHTNNDIINKQNGGSDVDILYTQDSGTNGLFIGLPYTATTGGDLTITTVANKSGSIVLKAHINETDNYKEASTTKTIKVELGLEAEYIEDQKAIIAGSKEAKPSSSTPLGHISVSGGIEPYSYAPKTGANQNSSFTIDNSTGKIYVSDDVGAGGLTPGNYMIEVEVSDSTSPASQKITVNKTITIGEAELSGVTFEDPDSAGASVSAITRTYDPAFSGGTFHTKLIETPSGSGVLKDTTITYSLEPASNNVLELVSSGIYGNFKIKKASNNAEKNNIKIKAVVKGGIYGTKGKSITINVNVDPYTQEIQFEQKAPYELSNTSACVSIPATKKSTYWNESATNKIKYTSSDTTKATIDANGNVCPVSDASGTITLTAELAKDSNGNYTKATAELKINILGELNLDYEGGALLQAVNPAKENDAGTAKNEAELGKIKVTGGTDQQYDIQIKSDDYAYAYLETKTTSDQRTSILKLKPGVRITADILKAGMDSGVIVQDETNKDQYNWTINVLPDTGKEAQKITVKIIGADPVLTFEQESDKTLTVTYQKAGTIDLSVKRGNSVMSTGVSVEGSLGYGTYIGTLSGIATDAQLNTVAIKKANCDDLDNVLAGKSFTVKPKSDAGDGYKSGMGNETPVIIKKAEHPKVNFQDADTTLSSYVTSVDKAIEGIEKDDDHLIVEPLNPVTWSGTTFEKYNSGDTTNPSVTITPNGFEGIINYVVNGGGTVNYKPVNGVQIRLAFSAEGGISYQPIKIIYGDDTKKVIDFITDENKDQCTYTYQPVSGNGYVNENKEEIFTLDQNTSTITTKLAGKTKIKVTRTDRKGNTLSQSIPVEIVKKEITLTYDSKTIYTGEALPTPAFKAVEEGTLAKTDTLDLFTIPKSAGHYKGTERLKDSMTAGTYDTKGDWISEELNTGTLKNYKVTLDKGTLTIKKDSVKDSWYHLENDHKETVSKDDWHNSDIDVVLNQAVGDAGVYDQISGNSTFTNTDKTRFTVSEEGEHNQSVYFRINPLSAVAHKGSITDTKATIKIDRTKPVIKNITGYPVNQDGFSELLNNLTFGTFFKPGIEVTIQAYDPQPANKSDLRVSQVKTITYQIYTLNEKGALDTTKLPMSGSEVADHQGKLTIKINKVGNYRVCAIAKDNATNPSNESCSDLNVKKIDVLVDGDNKPDFNDSDGDGCPDLNIKWKDPNDDKKWIIINGDRDYDGLPDLNIDSNGDGIPDLNVDTDHDGKPDLNLVILKRADSQGTPSVWKPKRCVVKDESKGIMEEYCTGTNVKPQINVDTTGNGIPNINIDTNGDFKPDFNIDTDNDGEADLNIGKVHEKWEPNKDDCVKDGFSFDTSTDGKPLINIDTNNDGLPDVNIDITGDGKADINIDIDGDGIPDIDIDSSGDGKPDINIDTTGDGNPNKNIIDITEWIPEKKVEGDIPYGTMEIEEVPEIKDNGIIVTKPSGGGFLPNHAIKVKDISEAIDEQTKTELDKVIGDQEVKKVYEVAYIKDQITTQPDGTIIMKIPVVPELQHPKVMLEQKDGSFKEVSVKEENGYYVFETEYVGKVSILGDIERIDPKPSPDPDPDPNTKPEPNPSTDPEPEPEPSTDLDPNVDPEPTQKTPVQEPEPVYKPSVQGTYVTNGMGGASTGDMSDRMLNVGIACFSLAVLCFIIYKRRI